MVAVLEPMIEVERAKDLKGILGFDSFVANEDDMAKIWVFSWTSLQLEIIDTFEQALTVSVFDNDVGGRVCVTFVYASCDGVERQCLWEYLVFVHQMNLNLPWCVVGDFNSMLSVSE